MITNKMSKSRSAGIVLIAAVYIAAALVGIALYKKIDAPFWLSLLIADVAATVVVFIFSVILRTASVYDPYWSMQPIVILTAYAFSSGAERVQVLLLISVWFWGVRLTLNWAYTFSNLEYEDWRYTMLREKTGGFYPLVNFFGIHLFPTIVVYLCTLPAVYTFIYPASFSALSLLFFALCIFAVLLQIISDHQMHRFRRRKTGGLIHEGLWKYSRHPNYLGEILMWWGIAGQALCALPGRVFFICGALLNTLMFLFVSIPMAERRQSEKAGFDQYKEKTPMLIPHPSVCHHENAYQ